MCNNYILRPFSLLLPLLFFLGGGVEASSQSLSSKDTVPLRLDIEMARRIALDENTTIKVADKEIQKAKYDRQAAIGKLLPSLSATGDYALTLKKQVMYLDNLPGMPPGMSRKGIEMGRTYNVTGGVVGSMPLFNASALSALSLTAHQIALAQKEEEMTKNNVVALVSKAFWGILLARESLAVIEQSYQNARTTYTEIKHKFDLGLVAEYDLIRADVAVRNIEPSLQQARNALSSTTRQLNILLSLPVHQPLECIGELSSQAPRLLEGYFQAERAPEDTPRMRKLQEQISLLQAQEKLQKGSFLPSLSLSGYYRINATSNDFSPKEYQWIPFSTIQLNLSVPLFSGGERISKVRHARLATEQARLQYASMAQSVRAEALQHRESMKAAVLRYVSAKEAVSQAQKGYEIARKRYEVGASTLVELNDALLAHLQAQLNYNQAIYDYLISEADLMNLSGELPPITTLR